MSNKSEENLSLIISLSICLGACNENRWGSCKLCQCEKYDFDGVSFAANFKTKGFNDTCTCGHNCNSHNPS